MGKGQTGQEHGDVMDRDRETSRFHTGRGLAWLLLFGSLFGLVSLAAAREPGFADRYSDAEPVVADINRQTIRVGEAMRLHMRARTAENLPDDHPPPTLSMRIYVRGMRFEQRREAWYRLSWRPADDQVGRHRVQIVAMDALNPEFDTERWIEIEVLPRDEGVGPLPVEFAADERSLRKAGHSVAPVEGKPPAASPFIETADLVPVIDPIPTQIVSTGQVVSFRVTARTADEAEIAMNIDRLPPHASFDRHRQGGRLFHWATSDSDQGEHEFVITAINGNKPSLQSQSRLTVIVGDPTAGATAPTDK